MTQEEVNTLTLTTYQVIRTKKTNKMYIDEDGAVHIYEIMGDADKYISETKDDSLYYDKPESIRALFFCTEAYDQGADKIFVKPVNKPPVIIEIKGDYKNKEVKRKYYNHGLNRAINGLQQTQKTKYLREIKSQKAIIPIIIDKRLPKQYQRIHFPYVKYGDVKEMFCIFTTLDEFKKWNDEQESKFEPYEIQINLFIKKHKQAGLIINPITDNIILTPKLISVMQKDKGAV